MELDEFDCPAGFMKSSPTSDLYYREHNELEDNPEVGKL
jgi:hypothetical protein